MTRTEALPRPAVGSAAGPRRPLASVVIPAHNEARVIGRLLRRLATGVAPGDLEIVVVCNGCTDDTAAVARAVSGVRVIEVPDPGKTNAVRVGGLACGAYPRAHVDADVEVSGGDLLRLAAEVRSGDVLAAAPRRVLPTAGSSWPVRAYYRVWQDLPQVRTGLFGRGVIVLSAAGQARVDALPDVLSDDLAISEAFLAHERRVVEDAVVVVHPPRTVGDLLRRRVRVVTGNAQASALGVRRTSSITTVGVLGRMAVRAPAVGLRMPVFLAFTVLARARARRPVRSGDHTTWLRDESSRA